VDLGEDHDNIRPDNKYDSKLPQLNQKQIYELVNNLTNRRPVKITENDSIFGNFDQVPSRIDRHYISNKSNQNEQNVLFVKSNNKPTNKTSNVKRHAVQIREVEFFLLYSYFKELYF
jgi:hypothetical protein